MKWSREKNQYWLGTHKCKKSVNAQCCTPPGTDRPLWVPLSGLSSHSRRVRVWNRHNSFQSYTLSLVCLLPVNSSTRHGSLFCSWSYPQSQHSVWNIGTQKICGEGRKLLWGTGYPSGIYWNDQAGLRWMQRQPDTFFIWAQMFSRTQLDLCPSWQLSTPGQQPWPCCVTLPAAGCPKQSRHYPSSCCV